MLNDAAPYSLRRAYPQARTSLLLFGSHFFASRFPAAFLCPAAPTQCYDFSRPLSLIACTCCFSAPSAPPRPFSTLFFVPSHKPVMAAFAL